MEPSVLPAKRNFVQPSPWSYVADSTRESAISKALTERIGHPVTVRTVSVSGSDTDFAVSFEIETTPPTPQAAPMLDTGIRNLSDHDLAALLCHVLEDLTSGARYEASINARSYGSSTGPAGYRPRPTRISLVLRQAAA